MKWITHLFYISLYFNDYLMYTAMGSNSNPTLTRQEYVAPISELFEINIERSILDVSRDGDNERTGEEDLF